VSPPARAAGRASSRGENDRGARSLARARAALVALAVGLPAGCHGALEAEPRRLEALAERGQVATATVTEVTRRGSDRFTHYVYEVGGVRYPWSVARSAAPYEVGAELPVLYSPEDPSFSAPGVDRARLAASAAERRAFAWKLEVAALALFGAAAIAAHLRLRHLRASGRR
jgi:hypothetical protein